MRVLLFLVPLMVAGCLGTVDVPAVSTQLPDGDISRAKAAVREWLRDPNSAEFRRIKTYQLETGDHVVCGEYNARNGFGGYTGFAHFYVRMTHSAVARIHVDDGSSFSGTPYGPANVACTTLADNGTIPLRL